VQLSKIIAIANESNLLDAVKEQVVEQGISFEIYDTFSSFIEEHDYEHNILILSLADLMTYFCASQQQLPLHNRHQFNCHALWTYTHTSEHMDILKSYRHGADATINLFEDSELLALKLVAHIKQLNALSCFFNNELEAIHYKNIRIDAYMNQIHLNNAPLDLTPSEFNLFYALAKNPHQVFHMEYLFQMITGQKSLGDYNALMTHMSRLRKKIACVDDSHAYILNVRNKGYKFNPHTNEYRCTKP